MQALRRRLSPGTQIEYVSTVIFLRMQGLSRIESSLVEIGVGEISLSCATYTGKIVVPPRDSEETVIKIYGPSEEAVKKCKDAIGGVIRDGENIRTNFGKSGNMLIRKVP